MPKRVISLFICCLLLLSYLPAARAEPDEWSFAGGGHTYYRSHTYTPAAMTRYAVNTLRHRNAGLTVENILSYTPNSGLRAFVIGSDRIYQSGLTIAEAAARLRDQGFDVVGGINGSFFNSDMTAIGLQIRNGVVTSYGREGRYTPAAGFTGSGEVVVGEPGFIISVTNPYGAVLVDRLNMLRSADRVHMYTRDFCATTRTIMEGLHIVIRSSERLSPGGTITGTVAQVLRGAAAHTIADDEIVLSASTQNAIERIEFLTEGSEVSISVASEDPRWNDVVSAAVGMSILVRGGLPAVAHGGTRAPRTAIGVREDGSVVMYTVDGRQSGHSAGLTLGETAERLIDMGCVTAIEMDGGGSTSIIARMPGEQNAALVNSPSDGRMRRCADFILLANVMPPSDGGPARLFPQPAYVTLLPNASVTFLMRATDIHYRAVGPPSGQIDSYPCDTGVGTSAHLTFTARNPGDTTVSFSSDGAAGTAQVRVASRLDAIELTANGQTVNEISVSPGQTVSLAASAVLDRAPVLSVAQSYIWETEGDIGAVTPDGVFTAARGAGTRTGRLTVTAAGTESSVSIPVTVTSPDAPFVQIEGPHATGSELVYTLTAIDIYGNIPEDVVIKWNGVPLPPLHWDTDRRAQVRVPEPASGLHILSADAADIDGRRTRQFSVYQPVRPDRWYAGYVNFLSGRNVIGGADGYNAEQPATRLEVARMFYRALSLPEGPASVPFDDIAALGGYDAAVARAVYAAGIFTGKTRADGTVYLDPDGLITRAELFTVLERTFPQGYDRASLQRFSDAGDVPSFALPSTRVLVGMGVVQGSGGRINPNDPVLRSEVCALFTRLMY